MDIAFKCGIKMFEYMDAQSQAKLYNQTIQAVTVGPKTSEQNIKNLYVTRHILIKRHAHNDTNI